MFTLQQKNNLQAQITYAHMLIVVAFLVVNFFGFLVITRQHEDL